MGRPQEELPIKENVCLLMAYPAATEFHVITQKHQEQLWFGRAQLSPVQGP